MNTVTKRLCTNQIRFLYKNTACAIADPRSSNGSFSFNFSTLYIYLLNKDINVILYSYKM